MKKKTILFDVDDTLIKTHEMASKFYEELAIEFETTKEKIVELKEKYKSTLKRTSDYLPDDLILFIGNILKKDIKKINNPFENETIYQHFLHPDSKETLEKLNKHFKLGIFSEGFNGYQSNKVYLSGIGDFFDKRLIYINKDKLDPVFVSKLPDGAIIVDDKKEVVEKLKALNRFNIVWINRKDNDQIDGVTTIKSLQELLIINLENFVRR